MRRRWLEYAAMISVMGVGLSCANAEAPADARKQIVKVQPSKTDALFDPARHMRTSEVRPGMTGYGVSVFTGTKLERFEVEVVSVLKNQMGPQQDVVLIRCKGQNLEHSGAVAGMSGSPIYLRDDQGRDRMIGAFALGWQFAKDPIAGVRPIEEMLRVPSVKQADDPVLGAQAGSGAAAGTWDARPMFRKFKSADDPIRLKEDDLNPLTMRPLGLPLSISGVKPGFVESIAPLLAGTNLQLLQAAAAGDAPDDAKDAKLEPGAAIGIPVVSGDLSLAAIGTVTEVLGDRVYAFGHSFLTEGAVELPMGVGYIHSVIASQAISFKIGSMVRTDGTIYSDESTAVAGTIGKSPQMIPIAITVRTPQRAEPQTYNYQVARHRMFTPLGSSIAIVSAILGHSMLPPEFTIKYTLKMQFRDDQVVQMQNQTTSLAGAMEFGRDLQLPMMLALQNPFAQTYPTRISGEVEVIPTIDAATVRAAVTDKLVYKPGETIRITLTTRRWKGEDQTHAFTVKLPANLPDGPITITIGDSQRFAADQMRFAPHQFQTQNIGDVFDMIRHVTADRTDQVYIRLSTAAEGVTVGRTRLAHLPESKKRLFTHSPKVDVATFPQSIVSKHPFPSSLIGSADLAITVSEHPNRVPNSMGTVAAPVAPGKTPPPQQQPPQQNAPHAEEP
jgi:hypothetical protein